MAKKKLKKKVQRRSSASKLGAPVADSARDVWLAGLGAFKLAQEESGKVLEQGSRLFDRLVQEGGKLEKNTRGDIEGAVADMRGEFESRISGVKQRTDAVKKQAADNWDKLEKIFEERVARALASLGIPTRDDINRLTARVQELSEQVELNGFQEGFQGACQTCNGLWKQVSQEGHKKSGTENRSQDGKESHQKDR